MRSSKRIKASIKEMIMSAVRNTEEGRVQVQGLLSKFLNCSIVELSLIQLKSLVPKGKE